jgi:predicted nucleic acid-binding protein
MHKTIIADTSCFILLANIGELDLLQKLYEKVHTTMEVANEYGKPFPEWVVVEHIVDENQMQLLELQIDKGEASAIILALHYENHTIILDDYKARKIAKQLSLNVTGTLGVIIKAKLNGIIPSIKPILEKISSTNFRISDEVAAAALFEAKES